MGSDLDVPDVVAMLQKQGGLCALSGCVLGLFQEDSFTQLSPDRIDPRMRRYTLDNVRLIMRAFQSCPRKGESEDDTVQWSPVKINACRKNHVTRPWNRVILASSHRGGKLLSNCKDTAKRRAIIDKKRKVESRRGEFTLTLAWFKKQWWEQIGRCAYSGMPMVCQVARGWRCSVERIDNQLGYTPENCILICSEFNVSTQWSREKFLKYVIGEE